MLFLCIPVGILSYVAEICGSASTLSLALTSHTAYDIFLPVLYKLDMRFEGRSLYLAITSDNAGLAERIIRFSGDDRSRHHLNEAVSRAVLVNSKSVLAKLVVFGGVDVNHKSIREMTPLMIASVLGHSDCVECLLRFDDIRVEDGTKHGFTPLEASVFGGHTEVALTLLEDGRSSLRTRSANNLLLLALEIDDRQIAKFLLANNVIDTAEHDTITGWTPLRYAVSHRWDWGIDRILELAPHTIDTKCKQGVTPLIQAVNNNDCRAAKRLLEAGADVRIADRCGMQPLQLAKTPEMSQCLLALGARTKARAGTKVLLR
ncbi:ankyrin repeat domain-containing protein [Aspergillus stella-maris]|uniref:ankyrin repeat domain-containing protein n=1 Tax=Aspergillus stella-maris TaxID=1810926 RepID=UPI003CCDD9A7